MSDQVREIALTVCDRLALFESRIATEAPGSPASVPKSLAGIADPRGAGSSFSRPLSTVIDEASDSELQSLLKDAARVRSEFDAIIAAGAGIVAKRSERVLGYAGLAQSTGDRTAVDMVQRLTGSTRTEAFRQVKLGGAMGEADAASVAVFDGAGEPSSPDGAGGVDAGQDGGLPGTDPTASDRAVTRAPWHEPLTRAAREGVIRTEAVTVIMRGLGEPNERLDAEALRRAAEEIVAEASGVHADELGRRARQLRDEIDPDGVRIRWDQRYQNRSWRFGRNADGVRTAWVQFDEESAAWADAIVGAAMRPRRGGPRFVDPAEAERAEKLRRDSRTNDQLVFDLMMDLLKAGAEADPTLAFGSRQPGVRVVVTQERLTRAGGSGATPPDRAATPDGGVTGQAQTPTGKTTEPPHDAGTDAPPVAPDAPADPDPGPNPDPDPGGGTSARRGSGSEPPRRTGETFGPRSVQRSDPPPGPVPGPSPGGTTITTGFFEETGDAVPASFIQRQICISGTTQITVNEAGTPLDVGREQRLFTARQRIALAIRDGGCQMVDCDRPTSYTEAHHIDEWVADNGKTDLADGILLCRYCHMLVHNNGWKIIRVGTGYFAVPPPSVDPEQKPIPLRKKSPLERMRRHGQR